MMNFNNSLNDNFSTTEMVQVANPCPSQRSITRPLLFVHNYSLFIFGSILNFLAFIVLIQRSLRLNSTFTYLAFLSLSNGLLSLVRFVQWMFTYYLKIQFENYLLTCRLSHFTLDLFTHFSLFTLVCVNIDRARAVTQNQPRTTFSKSPFRLVLMKELILCVILCIYHSHWLIKFGHEVSSDGVTYTYCHYVNQLTSLVYIYFLTIIYPPFELIVFFCLPLLINIICTIIIVRSLHVRMRTNKRLNKRKLQSTNRNRRIFENLFSYFIPRTTSQSKVYSCFGFQLQFRRHQKIRLKFTRQQFDIDKYNDNDDTDVSQQNISNIAAILNRSQRSKRTRDIHLSAMLIVLNILYLIFNLPYHIHQTFAKHIYNENSNECIMKFTHILLDTLQQTYFSTNFFLYVLTNRRFREEFYNTIRKIGSRQKQYVSAANSHRKQRTNVDFQMKTSEMDLTESLTSRHQSTVIFDDNKRISKTILSEQTTIENCKLLHPKSIISKQ